MDPYKNIKIPVFIPSTPMEAAQFLGECSRIKASGYPLRVSVLESPFRERLPADKTRNIRTSSQIRLPSGSDQSRGEALAAVSLAGLDTISEVSRRDLLVSAGSGVLLSTLKDECESRGLLLPFEPEAPFGERAVGELLMGGVSSRFEGRYGRFRESVLSVEMATAAGTLIHSGSRSVKDVTGYEIPGFLSGAGGEAGIVTGIVFRLLKAPGGVSTAAFEGPFESLVQSARLIRESTWPASMEIFSAEASSMLPIPGRSRGGSGDKAKSILVCEFHSALEEGEVEVPGIIGALPEGVSIAARDFSVKRAKEGLLKALARCDDGHEEGALRMASNVKSPLLADIEGAASWIRLFPHRLNIVWSGGKASGNECREAAEKLIEKNRAPGATVLLESMVRTGGECLTRRLDPETIYADGLSERLLSVFDPERIMER